MRPRLLNKWEQVIHGEVDQSILNSLIGIREETKL